MHILFSTRRESAYTRKNSRRIRRKVIITSQAACGVLLQPRDYCCFKRESGGRVKKKMETISRKVQSVNDCGLLLMGDRGVEMG